MAAKKKVTSGKQLRIRQRNPRLNRADYLAAVACIVCKKGKVYDLEELGELMAEFCRVNSMYIPKQNGAHNSGWTPISQDVVDVHSAEDGTELFTRVQDNDSIYAYKKKSYRFNGHK